jgi:hypothetical protein
LSATGGNLFIAGDFNLPTVDWSSPDYLNIRNYAVNSSLCQIVSEPTRFRQNQNPSTLDLILVNDPALVSQVDYLSPIGKSDHITLLSTIQLLVSEIPKKVTKLIKRVNYEYNKLKNDLESVQWTSDFFSSDDPNEMWEKFIIFLNTEIKNNTHTKYTMFNSSKPWINDDLLQLLKHKRWLWNKFKKSHAQQNYDTHRHFSNAVSANLHRARQAYEENPSTDPKKKIKIHQTVIE